MFSGFGSGRRVDRPGNSGNVPQQTGELSNPWLCSSLPTNHQQLLLVALEIEWKQTPR